MATYEKLVRDKIPARLDAKEIPYEKRIADDAEYRSTLQAKLLEETHEFLEAGDPEELADVLEVVAALRKLPEYANVEQLRLKKHEERGGFDDRIILKGDK